MYIIPDELLAKIRLERERQNSTHQFPVFNSDRLGILGEEFGEVCKAVNEVSNLEDELIQTAAVCIRWLEALERIRK